MLSTGRVLLSSDDLGVQCGRFCFGPLVAWELRSPYSCICCELGSCGFNVNVQHPLEEPRFQLWGSHGDSDLQAHLVGLYKPRTTPKCTAWMLRDNRCMVEMNLLKLTFCSH